ncbi:TPA: hypothetical protein ACPZBE_002741 [Morganella morganii]
MQKSSGSARLFRYNKYTPTLLTEPIMLTYKNIKEAHQKLISATMQRTVALRKIAVAMLGAYKESLQLPDDTFITGDGQRKPYVDTVLKEYDKVEPCMVAALRADENHCLSFYLRTAVNDDPHSWQYIDMGISISIQGDDAYVLLENESQPMIVILEPVDGQFAEVVERIKSNLILRLNSLAPA